MARLFLTQRLLGSVHRSPATLETLWRLEAGLARAFDRTSARMSPDRASRIGRALLRTLGPRLEKTRKFRRNFELAFPELGPQEVDALVRGAWGNLGAILAEFSHLPVITGTEASERCEVIVNGKPAVFSGKRTAAIFVQAHLGNWEVGPPAAVRLGADLKVLYTPLQNPRLDGMLREHRKALGCELIERQDAMRPMLRHLSRGGSIGLLTDQRVDSGDPVPFFGHAMNTTTTPARLALRFGCELIPVRVERLEDAHFRITCAEPIRPDPSLKDDEEQVFAMTRRINALYEQWIRERPEQWLCSKRRWPKDARRESRTDGVPGNR